MTLDEVIEKIDEMVRSNIEDLFPDEKEALREALEYLHQYRKLQD